MRCEEVRELISLYIDNELDEKESNEIKNHLQSCEDCAREYEDLLIVKKLLSEAPQIELPKNFKNELHEKLIECIVEENNEIEKDNKTSEDSEIIDFRKKSKKAFKRKNKFNWKVLSGAAAVILFMIFSVSSFIDNNFRMGNAPKMANEQSAPSEELAYDMKAESNDEFVEMEEPKDEARLYNQAPNDKKKIDDSLMEKRNTGPEKAAGEPQTISKYGEIRGMGRKIILTGYLHLEVEDYDLAYNRIIDIVNSKGGFVQNSNTSYRHLDRNNPEKSLKSGSIVIRIPQNEFDNIFNRVIDMGTTINQNTFSDDITKRYRDTYNEVVNLEIQEERLREIMVKADNVKDILEVERELTRVRGEINTLKGNLKKWDDLVDLSTINIDLEEVDLKNKLIENLDMSMWKKSEKGFIRSVNNLIKTFENMLIGFISFLPNLIVLSIALILAYAVFKRFKK